MRGGTHLCVGIRIFALLVAGRVDRRTRWGEIAWIHLLGGIGVGVAVGLWVGRRSCTGCAAGLAIARVQTVCRGGSSSIRLMEGRQIAGNFDCHGDAAVIEGLPCKPLDASIG